MICYECKKDFEPTKAGQYKFCSALCREKHYQKNKIYHTKYLKKHPWTERRQKVKVHRKCAFCEKEFDTLNNRQLYCSLSCKIDAQTQRARLRKEHNPGLSCGNYEHMRDDEQLCWTCQRCYGASECVWAESRTPIEGWEATPSTIYKTGFRITSCPLYIADEPREEYRDCDYDYYKYFDTNGNWIYREE